MAGSVITRLLASQGQYVDLESNQVVSGTKLIQILQTPNIPTVDNDVVNKQYHDNLVNYTSGINALSQWTQTHLAEVENYASGTAGTGSGSNPALESYASGVAALAINNQLQLKAIETYTSGISINTTKYGVRCYYSGTMTIRNATATGIPLSNERWDVGNFHNIDTPTLSTRITIPTSLAGYYLIGANIIFAANNYGLRTLYILLNSTTIINYVRVPASTTYASMLSLNSVYYLNDNDYIEAIAYQDSGGNVDLAYLGNCSPEVWVQRI